MNGPRHYAEAEHILECETSPAPDGSIHVRDETAITVAQVHATLALAAAVAELRSVAEPFNAGHILTRGETDTTAWLDVFESLDAIEGARDGD